MTPFQFGTHSVRVITNEKGEPLFVGKDVCDALGYARASDAMQQHCKGAAIYRPLQTAGGMQETRVIAEPDMMRLTPKLTGGVHRACHNQRPKPPSG
jgi:prophage antirepressor-like protein